MMPSPLFTWVRYIFLAGLIFGLAVIYAQGAEALPTSARLRHDINRALSQLDRADHVAAALGPEFQKTRDALAMALYQTSEALEHMPEGE